MPRFFGTPIFNAATLALASALCATAVDAHHASSALYDSTRRFEAVGVITRFVLKNPHSVLYFTPAGSGPHGEWQIEMGPPAQLARAGWTAERLKPGLRVRVSGKPARDTTVRNMCCATIVRVDGSPINPDQPSGAVP